MKNLNREQKMAVLSGLLAANGMVTESDKAEFMGMLLGIRLNSILLLTDLELSYGIVAAEERLIQKGILTDGPDEPASTD